MASSRLSAERYRALLRQLARELGDGWQSELARRWKVAPSLIQKQHAGIRDPGRKTIDAVVRDLGLDANFFTDPSLGAAPDYHAFARSKRSSRAGAPAYTSVDAWIAQSGLGRRLGRGEEFGDERDELVLKELRELRLRTGDPGDEVVDAYARSLVAQHRARAVSAAPALPAPELSSHHTRIAKRAKS